MKLTKTKLKRVIQEELRAVLNEQKTLDEAQRTCIIACINEDPNDAVMKAFVNATGMTAKKQALDDAGYGGCWTCVTDN